MFYFFPPPSTSLSSVLHCTAWRFLLSSLSLIQEQGVAWAFCEIPQIFCWAFVVVAVVVVDVVGAVVGIMVLFIFHITYIDLLDEQ
jgi:hypothetical protein